MTLVSNGLNNNTKPYTWTFADATARTSATGFVAADIGSWAVQLSDGTVWELTATTPTWTQRGGGSGLTNPMTTTGDLITGGASGAAQRLGIGTSGQVLTVVSGAPAWASGGGGGAPTSTPYVTTASDATLTAEVVLPDLAGSPDIAGAGGAGSSEEFDSASPTGFAWTPSAPAASDSNTTIKSALYINSTDATERFYVKTWSAAGAFDIRAKLCLALGAQNGAIGLYADDGSTSGIRVITLLYFNAASSNIQVQCYTSPSGGAFAQVGSAVDLPARYFLPVYVRLARDGSNVVTGYWSADGILWQSFGTVTRAATLTRLGVRSANAAHTGYVEWLRSSV